MELVYVMGNNRITQKIDSLDEVYTNAKYHRNNCTEGDLMFVNNASLKIKFYKRKGTKLFSITKPREMECQAALILPKLNLIR